MGISLDPPTILPILFVILCIVGSVIFESIKTKPDKAIIAKSSNEIVTPTKTGNILSPIAPSQPTKSVRSDPPSVKYISPSKYGFDESESDDDDISKPFEDYTSSHIRGMQSTRFTRNEQIQNVTRDYLHQDPVYVSPPSSLK